MMLNDGSRQANIAPPIPDVGPRVTGIKERHDRRKVVLTQFLVKEVLHYSHELNRLEGLGGKPPILPVNPVRPKDFVCSIYSAEKRSSPNHEVVCRGSCLRREGENSFCKCPGECETASGGGDVWNKPVFARIFVQVVGDVVKMPGYPVSKRLPSFANDL